MSTSRNLYFVSCKHILASANQTRHTNWMYLPSVRLALCNKHRQGDQTKKYETGNTFGMCEENKNNAHNQILRTGRPHVEWIYLAHTRFQSPAPWKEEINYELLKKLRLSGVTLLRRQNWPI